jgi:hypothetical protein
MKSNTKVQKLQKQIRTRFGSVERFCDYLKKQEIDLNYYTVTNAFSGRLKHDRNEIVIEFIDLVLTTSKIEGNDHLITDKDRSEIRLSILQNFRNVRTFSKLYDQFTPVFIHNVISGKRKKRDQRFHELKKTLNHEGFK